MSMPKKTDLIQGTLDLLILKTVANGPIHGYGIAQRILVTSKELLQVQQGSLYPALHRLEKQGWIKSEWDTSEHNQRAKFYQLTAAGKKQLNSEHSRWKQMSAAISSLMKPGESEGQA